MEELQQKALTMAAVQENQERENLSLRKEVAVLKRQRTDSIGNSVPTASGSRSASGSVSSSMGETRYPKDDSQEEAHLSVCSTTVGPRTRSQTGYLTSISDALS